jgi:hypothetical protein
MAHTREQRDHLSTPLCGAKKKNGEPCRKFAGEGTDHHGYGKCKYHGGATASHKKHAIALEAKSRMIKLGHPMTDARPHQVLLDLLRQGAGHVAWLNAEVGTLEDLSAHESRVILRLYDEERDRLTRIAKACSQAGVDEAEIHLQQAHAELFVQAIYAAARDIGLDADQLGALGLALRKNLAVLNGDTDAAQREDERLRPRVEAIRTRRAQHEQLRAERAAAERPPADLAYPPEEWIPEDPDPEPVTAPKPSPRRNAPPKSWLPPSGA